MDLIIIVNIVLYIFQSTYTYIVIFDTYTHSVSVCTIICMLQMKKQASKDWDFPRVTWQICSFIHSFFSTRTWESAMYKELGQGKLRPNDSRGDS